MGTFALPPVSLVFCVFISFAFISKPHALQTGINYTARKLGEILANKCARGKRVSAIATLSNITDYGHHLCFEARNSSKQ
jgi:hypothetical protein